MRASLIAAALACSATVSYAGGGGGSPERRDDDHRNTPNVYDAQGALVGPLASASGVSGVFLSVNGALTFAPIIHSARDYSLGRLSAPRSASQYQWSDSASVPYASGDCSGTPLIPQPGNTQDTSVGRPSLVVRIGADATLYVASDAYSSANVTGSFLTTGVPSSCFRESPGNFTSPAWPAESAYPITQHYPEPLSVRFGEHP
jgi:hypothetical protein